MTKPLPHNTSGFYSSCPISLALGRCRDGTGLVVLCAKAECSSEAERDSRWRWEVRKGKPLVLGFWPGNRMQPVCGSNSGTWLQEVTSNGITPQLRVRNQHLLSGCRPPGRAPAQRALRRKEVPHPLGKQPPIQLRSRPLPLSTQLARSPRGAGQKGPGTPPRPRDYRALAFSTLPRDLGTVATLRPARDSKHPPRAPRERGSQSRALRAGGGAEAGAAPGEGAGGPGAQRAAREGRRPAAAAAACSACPRPGTRSLQLTPPAARGLPLPSREEPAAAQVSVAGAGRGGERVGRGAGRGSWAEAGRGAGCWSLGFLAQGPGGFPPARPGSWHPASEPSWHSQVLGLSAPPRSSPVLCPLWHFNCALAFLGAFVHSPWVFCAPLLDNSKWRLRSPAGPRVDP